MLQQAVDPKLLVRDAPLQLSVVVPTKNEIGNIEPLLERLGVALAGIEWEAIFVDDSSTDGTPERLTQIALHQPADAELNAVTLARRTLSLSGRAHAPDAAELALRRAFEGEEISFSRQDGEAPQTFTAELSFAPEAAP